MSTLLASLTNIVNVDITLTNVPLTSIGLFGYRLGKFVDRGRGGGYISTRGIVVQVCSDQWLWYLSHGTG